MQNNNHTWWWLSITKYREIKWLRRDMTKPTKWVCAQRSLRSAWASAQSDQGLRCPLEECFGPKLPTERKAKTLVRLGGCPGWSESSLGAHSLSNCWCCPVTAHVTKTWGLWLWPWPWNVDLDRLVWADYTWATSRENLSSALKCWPWPVGLSWLHMSHVTKKTVFGISNQVRLKLACSDSETISSLEILEKTGTGIILSKKRSTKVLIRLRGCAGWSAPLLFAYG